MERNGIEDKNRLINEILAHQEEGRNRNRNENHGQRETDEGQSIQGNQGNQGIQGQVKPVLIPDKETLDKFRELVNGFIQADDFKKKLQNGVKEQNARVKKLSCNILSFMAKYNIEDLKASNGIRLRYKKTVVNEPLSAKKIKERLEENPELFKNKTSEEIANELFQRGKVEKISLRRLKRNTLEV